MRSNFILVFALLSALVLSQNNTFLLRNLKIVETDTQKITLLNSLTKAYLNTNPDSAELFNKQCLKICQNNKYEFYSYSAIYYKAELFRKHKKIDSALFTARRSLLISKKYNNFEVQANAQNLIGIIYEQLGKQDSAIKYFQATLNFEGKPNLKKEIATAHLHLGIYFKKHDKATFALFHLLRAMSIADEINDLKVKYTTCINLGTMYERTKDNAKAMNCYKMALSIVNSETPKIENDFAICYFKIGKLFQNIGIKDSAKAYLYKTLQIHLKLNDKDGLIFDYSNLASFDLDVAKYKEAEKNYNMALNLAFEIKDSLKINLIYASLADLYAKMNLNDKALSFYEKSLAYTNQRLISKESMMLKYKKIANIYINKGDYKQALNNYIQYKAWSDSSYNINETKKQTELKLNYEFEKVQKKIEDEARSKELQNTLELEKERIKRKYYLIGFLIISGLLILTIKSYRTSRKANLILQKQKIEIELQKKLVDEKNLEIKDSINYALKIQTATTPKLEELTTYFKNHSILFKPKDIVSGDFYWAASYNEFSLLAIADCTGHGVPGAITNMIGCMLLNEIFYVKHIHQPNLVLTELNRLVKLTLRQQEDVIANDGMDIAFCMFNNITNELLYSGANRPIYKIDTNKNLLEYKPTKVSIGGQIPLIQEYELKKIQLQKGDLVIISSDGFADQFGGLKEKKLSTKKFKSILVENSNLNPKEITNYLNMTFENWKGKYEQTDDILVFVLKV